MPGASADIRSEERMMPVIRAMLAARLSQQGLSVKDTARALNVTSAAVTQYLNKKRGSDQTGVTGADSLMEPLVEKLVKRSRSGLGGIETMELLEAARQVLVISAGSKIAQGQQAEPERTKSLELLRGRLQLELKAAEKYLELANRTPDDYTKLLLRMIASDSIRHADVVSQIISWLEAGNRSDFEAAGRDLLESMLAIEDSANEESLRETVDVAHPVARILLEWIDIDEAKHGKVVSKMVGLSKKPKPRGRPTQSAKPSP